MFSTNVNLYNVINKKPNPASIGYAISIKDGMACFSLMSGSLASRKPVTTLMVLKPLGRKVICRTMMSAKSIHFARAVYHSVSLLLNNSVIDLNNKKTISQSIVDLSLDPNTGIPQHKTSIMKHMLAQKFDADAIYGAFSDHMASINTDLTKIIKWEPNSQVDARCRNEWYAYKNYLERFYPDIEWSMATNDTRPGNFPFQTQTNQDFWVMLRTAFDKATAPGYKCVPQDEKSGMGMFEHSTRGSIGVLTYDSEGLLIPFINKQINLAINDQDRLVSIRQAASKDNFEIDNKALLSYDNKWKSYVSTSILDKDLINIHNEMQAYLWDNFQRHPAYKRSISFVFIDEMKDLPIDENTLRFAEHFKSLLQDRFYNLHNRHDRRDVFHAMLIAGKENIDADLINKIRYLSKGGKVEFTNIFLEDLASLIKKQALKI